MPSDLLATRQRILAGEWTASRAVDDAIARARSPAGRDAFVLPRFDEARAEAARFDRETARAARRPLAGLPFSVKDLFDVEGQVAVAAAEAAVGLAILISYFRIKNSVETDKADLLKH